MEYIILIIIGALGGVLAGMGMGGGTLLIPLLTAFGGIGQHAAQGINLAAFILTAPTALFIHIKNKLVNVKSILFIMIPACVFSLASSLCALYISAEALKKIFGIFLIVLGVGMLASDAIRKLYGIEDNKNKLEQE